MSTTSLNHILWATMSFEVVSSIAHVEEREPGNQGRRSFTLNVSGANHIFWGTMYFELISLIAHIGESDAEIWKCPSF